MSVFAKSFVFLAVVLMVPLAIACGDDSSQPAPGTGGSGGSSGTGGSGGGTPPDPVEAAVQGLCERLDDCNFLDDFGHPNVSECIDDRNFCLDQNYPTGAEKQDWAQAVDACLDLQSCGTVDPMGMFATGFLGCYLEIPGC